MDTKWELYKGVLTLVTPPGTTESLIEVKEVRDSMKRYGSRMALWTSDLENESYRSCWYIVKNSYTGLEEYSSNTRNQVRKGLKNCQVRRISADIMKESAYPVYLAAMEGYSSLTDPVMTRETFIEDIRRIEEDREFWGVFSPENSLIGFCNVLVQDRWSSISAIKLNPEYRQFYPMYALIHTLSEHYLGELNYSYLSAGMRSISHETNFQNLLLEKFRFRKAYCRLNILYKPFLGVAVRLVFPIRGLLVSSRLGVLKRISVLMKLESIRRQLI